MPHDAPTAVKLRHIIVITTLPHDAPAAVKLRDKI